MKIPKRIYFFGFIAAIALCLELHGRFSSTSDVSDSYTITRDNRGLSIILGLSTEVQQLKATIEASIQKNPGCHVALARAQQEALKKLELRLKAPATAPKPKASEPTGPYAAAASEGGMDLVEQGNEALASCDLRRGLSMGYSRAHNFWFYTFSPTLDVHVSFWMLNKEGVFDPQVHKAPGY